MNKTLHLKKDLNLRVLIYEQDEENDDECFVALAIDMDLRGYGDTEAEALEEMREMVDTQLSFAQYQNDLRGAFFPADQKYYDMFAAAQKTQDKEVAQWRQSLEHLGALPKEEDNTDG